MDHPVGLELAESLQEERIMAEIADMDANPAAAEGFPERGMLVQVGPWEKGLPVEFGAGPAAEIFVHPGSFVAPTGKEHGRGPAQATVSPKDQDTHAAILMPTEGERSSGKSRLLKRKAFISSLLMASPWEELYG